MSLTSSSDAKFVEDATVVSNMAKSTATEWKRENQKKAELAAVEAVSSIVGERSAESLG